MQRLRVDPTRCVGYGLCVGLLPERIQRDDWGYAMVDGRPVPVQLLQLAERAVRECPAMALRLEHAEEEPRAMRPRRGAPGAG